MIVVRYRIVCIWRAGVKAAKNVIVPGINIIIITVLYYLTDVINFQDTSQYAFTSNCYN